MVQDYVSPVRVHKIPFEMVMAAYERRFPCCPQIAVVVDCAVTEDSWSSDDSQRDTVRRCQLHVEAPYLLKKMIGVDHVYFIQKNHLDLKNRVLEIQATNESFSNRVDLLEECRYFVHPEIPEWTCFEQKAKLDVKNFFGLEGTVEKIAMKQYAANIAKGKQLIELFMSDLSADGVTDLKPWREGDVEANRQLRHVLCRGVEPLTPKTIEPAKAQVTDPAHNTDPDTSSDSCISADHCPNTHHYPITESASSKHHCSSTHPCTMKDPASSTHPCTMKDPASSTRHCSSTCRCTMKDPASSTHRCTMKDPASSTHHCPSSHHRPVTDHVSRSHICSSTNHLSTTDTVPSTDDSPSANHRPITDTASSTDHCHSTNHWPIKETASNKGHCSSANHWPFTDTAPGTDPCSSKGHCASSEPISCTNPVPSTIKRPSVTSILSRRSAPSRQLSESTPVILTTYSQRESKVPKLTFSDSCKFTIAKTSPSMIEKRKSTERFKKRIMRLRMQYAARVSMRGERNVSYDIPRKNPYVRPEVSTRVILRPDVFLFIITGLTVVYLLLIRKSNAGPDSDAHHEL